MNIRCKFILTIMCVLHLSLPSYTQSFLQSIKNFFSFNISSSILNTVNKNIQGSIKAKNIKIILPNKVELEDVEVIGKDEKGILYAKKVKFSISLPSLLTSNYTIKEAFIDSPHFHYIINDKTHNVIEAFKPNSKKNNNYKPPKIRISVKEIKLVNGSYEMEHSAGVHITANGVFTKGDLIIEPGPFRGEFTKTTVKSGMITIDEIKLPLEDVISHNLVISDEVVYTNQLTGHYENAIIRGAGTVYIDEERYDLTAHIDAPKGTYPQGLEELPFIVPSFKAKSHILGHLEEPEINTALSFGSTNFEEVYIKSGKADAFITPHQVLIKEGHINLLHKGLIKTKGSVNIDSGDINFNSKAKNIKASILAQFLSFPQPVSGRLNSSIVFSSNFRESKDTLNFDAKGFIQNGSVPQLILAKKSQFKLDFSYILKRKLEIKNSLIKDAYGLYAKAKGHVDLQENSYDISYQLIGDNLGRYLPKLEQKIELTDYKSQGTVSGQKSKISLKGSIDAKRLQYDDFVLDNNKANISLNNRIITITKYSSKAANGQINGNLKIFDIFKNQKLKGEFKLAGAQINEPIGNLGYDKVFGKLDATITLNGPLNNLNANLTGFLKGFKFKEMQFGRVKFDAYLKNNKINITSLLSQGRIGSLQSQHLSANLISKSIAGVINLNNINLKAALAPFTNLVEGNVDGRVNIGGTFNKPNIHAPLNARKVKLGGQNIGHGPLTIRLKEQSFFDKQKSDLVLLASSNLVEKKTNMDLRLALALKEKTINSQILFDSLKFNSNDLPFESKYAGIEGEFNGKIVMKGALSKPNIKANAKTNSYALFNPNEVDDLYYNKIYRGPANINLELENNYLDANACFLLTKTPENTNCKDNNALSFLLKGPFSFEAFNIRTIVELDHNHLETIIFPLKNELSYLEASMRLEGTLLKEPKKSMRFNQSLYIDKLLGSTPSIPTIRLDAPTSINITNNQIFFNNEAVLLLSPGQLVLNGGYKNDALNLIINGSIPLILTRFALSDIKQAQGLATGNLSISGSLESPIFEGNITPRSGSTMSFRNFFEPMEIKNGSIGFIKTSANSYATKIKNFEVSMGEGYLKLNAEVNNTYKPSKKKNIYTFDMKMNGSNILIRHENDFVEADFDLATFHETNQKSITEGKIVITDGSVHRQFDLRNFVAQAQDQSDFDTDFLENLQAKIDINILIRQLNVSARMLNIDINTFLRGQIKAIGNLQNPKFTGNILVDEGNIEFPATTFEMTESRIEFDDTSHKSFDPQIHIRAIQEIPREAYPSMINQDTTVELELIGNTEKLNLNLRPLSGDFSLTQTKLLLLLLLPNPLSETQGQKQTELIKEGAKRAALALSGEVFLRPLTNELQDLLESTTKTRIQFGSSLTPGGVTLKMNWKIGPRIELQGSYLFRTGELQAVGQESQELEIDKIYPLGDIRLKLLLFDHKPLGPLYFESILSSNWYQEEKISKPSGSLKLKYTIISK